MSAFVSAKAPLDEWTFERTPLAEYKANPPVSVNWICILNILHKIISEHEMDNQAAPLLMETMFAGQSGNQQRLKTW